MTFWTELQSWSFPIFTGHPQTSAVPEVGDRPSSLEKLKFPTSDNRGVLLCFLRHCGCPFAEKSFSLLRNISQTNAEIRCIAVSHSDQTSTDKWLESVGGAGKVEVIVDHERHLYSAYGLGYSGFWPVLNPWSLSKVYEIGKSEGIWNRPTESGSRWQVSGVFGIAANGTVEYSHVAASADDLGDLDAAVMALRRA